MNEERIPVPEETPLPQEKPQPGEAKRKRGSQYTRTDCAIQVIGLLLFLGGLCLFLTEPAMAFLGMLVGIVVLAVGAMKSSILICSACGAEIAKDTPTCPSCGREFH